MSGKMIENVISLKYDHIQKRLTLLVIRPREDLPDEREELEFNGIKYIASPFPATFKVDSIRLDHVLANVVSFSEPVKVAVGDGYAHILKQK